MVRVRRPRRLEKAPIRLSVRSANGWAKLFSKRKLSRAVRVIGPTLIALTFAGVAHAQGTMDFSGAQTLMGTFNFDLHYELILLLRVLICSL
jgi:hypothetical protein